MTKKILFPISDGVEDTEFVSVADVLRRAGGDLIIASANPSTSSLRVVGEKNIRFEADNHITEVKDQKFDLIVIVGGDRNSETLSKCETLITMLRRQREEGRWIAALCSTPAIVLGQNGLLEGVRATCHPEELSKFIPDKSAIGERIVVSNNVITSKSAGTALEFACKIVESLFGKGCCDTIAREYLINCSC
eukprot:TRINITY_DN469_c1_g1_i1.p1 TRINITY_DN469_c1_g1~~TRINITY_DN469_c1_g1_i1.p1  ORF type:complete len:192 (-),score=56.81 TRINITY_DN469_c1_g1_i1:55-630(-)